MTDGWNEKSLYNPEWPQANVLEKEITFDGGTTNAIGDESGTQNPYTLLTVTGLVEMTIIARCSTTLVGAATIEVGTATTTAGLIAQVADATDITAKDIWHDAVPDASIELTSVGLRRYVAEDVKIKIGTTDITAGVITFYVRWSAISEDGNVVIA